MASQNYVFSTLSQNQLYANYDDPPEKGGDPILRCKVLIVGGAGVINQVSLATPQGMSTAVTDEQLSELEKNADFRRHKAAGYITVRARGADAAKVAQDMTRRDKSAQYTVDSPEFKTEKYIEVE